MIYYVGVVLGFVVFCLFLKYLRDKPFYDKIMEFGGEYPWPLIGNSLQYNKDCEGIAREMNEQWEKFGWSRYRAILPGVVVVALTEPEDVQLILESKIEITKPSDYNIIFHRLVGDAVAVCKGDKWRSRRKMITPSFHLPVVLDQYFDLFNEKTNILIGCLEKNVGKMVDISHFIGLLALDITCASSMGIDFDLQNDPESKYVTTMDEITKIFNRRSFTAWKRIDFLYQFSSDYKKELELLGIWNGFVDGVIKSKKEQLMKKVNDTNASMDENQPKKRKVFLDMLLTSKTPEGHSLTEQEIRDEVNLMFFANSDTSACCASFTIYELANNPEIQQLAYEEQLSIFGYDKTKPPTHSDCNNMNYLERVIKESLRLYPPGSFIARTNLNDVTLPDGKVLPVGTVIMIHIYQLGRNPRNFPDPNKFDPDRHLPENCKNWHPYLYIPFSAGPRNCIGQKFAMLELKVWLSMLLRNYKFLSAGPENAARLIFAITTKSENGINVILEKRE